MNYLSRVVIILIIILKMNMVYASAPHEIETIQQRIREAENNADINLLENLFTDDAVYLNPEGPPIVGNHAIQSLYELMLNRYNWSSSYQNNATEIKGDSARMRGMHSYKLIPKDTQCELGSMILHLIIHGSQKTQPPFHTRINVTSVSKLKVSSLCFWFNLPLLVTFGMVKPPCWLGSFKDLTMQKSKHINRKKHEG